MSQINAEETLLIVHLCKKTVSIHLLWYVNTSSVSQSTKVDHLKDKGERD